MSLLLGTTGPAQQQRLSESREKEMCIATLIIMDPLCYSYFWKERESGSEALCFFHYQGVEKCLLGIIESFAVSCACVQVPLIMSLIKARGIGIL